MRQLLWTLAVGSAVDWGYTDTNWGNNPNYPLCNGYRQSPIDLQFQDIPLGDFHHYLYFTQSATNCTSWSSPYTWQVRPEPNSNKVSVSFIANLSFTLDHLQMHWDASNGRGSEHRLNGRVFPLEIHHVHRKPSCATLSDCMTTPGGIVVFAVLVEIGAANPAIETMLQYSTRPMQNTSSYMLPSGYFLPEAAGTEFLFYDGSLTTPPCAEVVQWMVARRTITVSQAQLDKFRSIQNGRTWRPLQQFNGREAASSWSPVQWDYDNYSGVVSVDRWKEAWSACGGTMQSPIDLPAAKHSGKWTEVREQFTLKYEVQNSSHIQNDGLALKMDAYGELNFRGRKYQLRQLEFHWGDHVGVGSEHTREGKALPLEMQLLHYDVAYGGFEEATTGDASSLLIISVLFNVGEENPGLKPIVDILPLLKRASQDFTMTGFSIEKLLPSLYNTEFMTYSGSLTTPPCSESVLWVILSWVATISEAQLEQFRTLAGRNGQKISNFRPIQPRGRRDVVDNLFETEEAESTRTGVYVGIAGAMVLTILLSIYCGLRCHARRKASESEGLRSTLMSDKPHRTDAEEGLIN